MTVTLPGPIFFRPGTQPARVTSPGDQTTTLSPPAGSWSREGKRQGGGGNASTSLHCSSSNARVARIIAILYIQLVLCWYSSVVRSNPPQSVSSRHMYFDYTPDREEPLTRTGSH